MWSSEGNGSFRWGHTIPYQKREFKKKVNLSPITHSTQPLERNRADIQVAEILGIGATRVEERIQASRGGLSEAVVRFENADSVAFAGVLLLLPFLKQSGLFTYRDFYEELNGYYFLDQIFLLCAFMYLCRIKNPEQLKKISPGEYGKLLGLDRIPETTRLRKKLHQLYDQQQAENWSKLLTTEWIKGQQDNDFFYIDGHTQVYYGYAATLGKKYVSRQKLCLPGMQDFWVNDSNGMPYFYVRGQVNEKLLEMIESSIIPRLIEEVPCKYSEEQLSDDPYLPRFTIVFDREGYSPDFFSRLWDEHRIAVLTYRKNVKDLWDDKDFHPLQVPTRFGDSEEMMLAQKEIELSGCTMLEVRKLGTDKHQTSVITTNLKLTMEFIAFYMFSRWLQENFFRYMRQNYDFDSIYKYAVEQLNTSLKVVNPIHSKLTYQIKKLNEKKGRRQAKLLKSLQENSEESLESTPRHLKFQNQLIEQITELEKQLFELKYIRKQSPYKITIADMPEQLKYNKLHEESKLLQNIIKIICYRAETSFASHLSSHFKKSKDEIRELVKAIARLPANIKVDDQNKLLTIQLFSLANPRSNLALKNTLALINDTQTTFPGTNLVLYYEFAT